MTTRELVIVIFMVVGAILVGLAGLNISNGHYKDIVFFPAGVCSFMIGMILDRVWKAS